MKKVIGIGETVWDVFPSGKRLGGAPVNFAFFAKEFGADVYPVSAIGIDELGDETLEALKGTGLNLDYIQRNDKPTSRVLVTMDSAGVPEYEIVEGVAWDFMSCDSKTLGLFSDADVICCVDCAISSVNFLVRSMARSVAPSNSRACWRNPSDVARTPIIDVSVVFLKSSAVSDR